jgi:hypothetical protein
MSLGLVVIIILVVLLLGGGGGYYYGGGYPHADVIFPHPANSMLAFHG